MGSSDVLLFVSRAHALALPYMVRSGLCCGGLWQDGLEWGSHFHEISLVELDCMKHVLRRYINSILNMWTPYAVP